MWGSWMFISLCWLYQGVAHGGKILVFSTEGSNWVNMKILIEKLHSHGHEVSLVRPSDSWYMKESSPFYKTITLDAPSGFDENFFTAFVTELLNIQRGGERSLWKRIQLEMEMMQSVVEVNEKTFKMIQIIFENKEVIQSFQDAEYNLVLTDPILPVGTLVAHYLKVPLVFNARWTSQWDSHFTIAPSPPSYCPIVGSELTDKMTFYERVINVLFFGYMEFNYFFFQKPSFDGLIKKYLGPEMDYVSMFQAADLWLMRVDFVFEFPRPTMPNVKYMGGYQCKPAKALPQHLEEFMQSSGEHGVIIMSLGTLIAQLPHELSVDIAVAFAKLPQKVIWRYKGERPATLGNNTLLVEWLPQNDLLGHPKTKAFVTHGGTNGVQEAIYHGVPIVGLPLIFDQWDNLLRIEVRGAGKIMDVFTINEGIFYEGVQAVLTEPSYRENMQRMSRLHRDTPIAPLDNALFWIEFVMRHKGAAHLRTESYKMPWYSYHSVDVMFVLAGVVLTTMGTSFILLKCFCSACLKKKPKRE